MTSRELTPAMEYSLSKIIVSMHLHKKDPAFLRVKSFVIRKGWGAVIDMLKREEAR